MASSKAKIDVSDVLRFEKRLETAARIVEAEAEQYQQHWGEAWADEMRASVEVDTGNLQRSIDQVEPGGITFGDAFYWRFLEYGTSRMAPRPFVRPAMKRIRTPARKDAGERAIEWIRRGR